MLEDDEIAKTYAQSVGMVKNVEIVQYPEESEEDFGKRKEEYEKFLCGKYFDITNDNGLLMKGLLEMNKVDDKKKSIAGRN